MKGRPKPFSHHQQGDPEKEARTTFSGGFGAGGGGGGGAKRPAPFSHHAADKGDQEKEARTTFSGTSASGAGKKATPFAHHTGKDDKKDVVIAVDEDPVRIASTGSLRSTAVAGAVSGALGEGERSSALAQAATEGAEALKEALVTYGTGEINMPDALGMTPLMHAIDECPPKDLVKVVRMLMVQMADVNAKDAGGDTPLMKVIERDRRKMDRAESIQFEHKQLECINALLDKHADPELRNKRSGQSALEMCGTVLPAAVEVIESELWLRIKEAQVPSWEPGNPLPEAELEDIENCRQFAVEYDKKRVAAHLKAYQKALRVLEQSSRVGGLHLDFVPDSTGFVPPSAHTQTAEVREALEGADAYLREYGCLPKVLSGLVFDGLLPLLNSVYKQYRERYATKAAQESLVRFVAGKRSAYLKGYEWAFSELIETKEADALAKVVALGSSFPSGSGESKPKQIRSKLEDVMVDASHAQRRVLLLAARVAKKAEGNHFVVHKGDGGRNEPTQKRLFRSNEKVCLGDGPDTLLDVARGGVECPSMEGVRKALQCLLDEAKRKEITLLRMKMRFDKPSDGGWRDALVNFTFQSDESQHVCELQVMHVKMMTIRSDMGAHHDYAQFRGAVELLEQYGINWQEMAAEMEKEAGSKGSSSPSAAPDKSAGAPDGSAEVAKQAARIKELEEVVRKKDERIAELEGQLQAARDGPESHVRKKFQQWDKNGDGIISQEELVEVMQSLGGQFSEEETKALFNHIDKDKDGKVDYNEFVSWVFGMGAKKT
mmetsp:Transcript_64123/g.119225  ORF Transcript_64123/g.119225 Transcript_64123/m.119225 type:complete len:776 (-) Transcript_64123:71-2398(-)